MKPLQLANQWVLVTGASAGLGRAVAFELAAKHHANLLLVARRGEVLQQLRTELQAAHGVQVEVLAANLAEEAEVGAVARRAEELGVSAAVLNAGITHLGAHAALPFADFKHMLALNVTGTVQLASALVTDFRRGERDTAVLMVASIAGLIPLAYQAAYAATKAFVVSFGLSLGEELATTSTSITVFAPGGIATDFINHEGMNKAGPWLAPPAQVARELVEALVGRQRLVVPGTAQRLGVWGARLLPHKMLVAGTALVFRRLFQLPR